jgi:aldehyde:ferredoxin oxidoreductase
VSEPISTTGVVGTSIAEQAAATASWGAVLGGGLAAVMAASKAVAVAVETQQLSVDPQLVDSMIKKLDAMQDELGRIMRDRNQLSVDMKLGGGYAMAIAKANTQFGSEAIKQIEDVNKAIESLKVQIEKSRASYRNVDQGGADSLNKINGKS